MVEEKPVCLAMIVCEDVESSTGRLTLVNPLASIEPDGPGKWPLELDRLGLFGQIEIPIEI